MNRNKERERELDELAAAKPHAGRANFLNFSGQHKVNYREHSGVNHTLTHAPTGTRKHLDPYILENEK